MENIVEIKIDESSKDAKDIFNKMKTLFENSEFEVTFLTKSKESMSRMIVEDYYIQVKRIIYNKK